MSAKTKKDKVLLTGVSGFLGLHTAIQLLEKGYHVVGTMRNLERAEEIRKIASENTSNTGNLEIVQADLMDDPDRWNELMKGVDYVQHIASPFPQVMPKTDDELIRPAKTGTLNVLKAASGNKVKRVVVTSSAGAIAYGKSPDRRKGVFNENDWTDINNLKDTTPYFRSKTIAEREAWNFMENGSNGLELATVCPGAILGPALEKDYGTSANIVVKTMDGSSPAIPKIGFEIVDVRSVAEMLILAMEKKEAAGQRFISAAGFMSIKEVAGILREAYPDKKIPKRMLPNFFARLIASFEKTLKPILVDLGSERRLDNSKARELLNWEPIPPREAVLACAESVVRVGIVK